MSAVSLFLIGTPACGKTTVFEALTNTPEGPHYSSKGAHRIGTVKVPDPRLDALCHIYRPKKCIPAEVTFVDVALPPVHGDEPRLGALTKFLSDADAFLLVVQAFGEIDYRGHRPDPRKQLESVVLELVVTDLEKIERRFERLEKERNRGVKTISETEAQLLEKCRAALEEGRALRRAPFSGEEEKLLRGYAFLSAKPILVVANVPEQDPSGENLLGLQEDVAARDLQLITFCAPLEAEIAQLGAEEQQAFLQDYGLAERAGTRLIQSAYRGLELMSFFTVGDDEVRAWTIRNGTPAQQAAGKVHTDMERGFIRAETVPASELIEAGSWAACREAAKLRLEGKNYVVQDGDVIHFRFST